jgi:hypothetical protein
MYLLSGSFFHSKNPEVYYDAIFGTVFKTNSHTEVEKFMRLSISDKMKVYYYSNLQVCAITPVKINYNKTIEMDLTLLKLIMCQDALISESNQYKTHVATRFINHIKSVTAVIETNLQRMLVTELETIDCEYKFSITTVYILTTYLKSLFKLLDAFMIKYLGDTTVDIAEFTGGNMNVETACGLLNAFEVYISNTEISIRSVVPGADYSREADKATTGYKDSKIQFDAFAQAIDRIMSEYDKKIVKSITKSVVYLSSTTNSIIDPIIAKWTRPVADIISDIVTQAHTSKSSTKNIKIDDDNIEDDIEDGDCSFASKRC